MTANSVGADGNASAGRFCERYRNRMQTRMLVSEPAHRHEPFSSPTLTTSDGRAREDVYSLQVNTIHHPLPTLSSRDRVRHCGEGSPLRSYALQKLGCGDVELQLFTASSFFSRLFVAHFFPRTHSAIINCFVTN